MDALLSLLGSQAFISFLGTFGLAVVLVLYFVFFQEPKRDKFWQDKYDQLLHSWQEKYDQLLEQYKSLSDTYKRLESDLRPETRICSDEQSHRLVHLGLDRDLYKLYYYLSEKLHGKRPEDLEYFIEDSIRDTNESWSKFISPFPKVQHIGNLYGVYKKQGEAYKLELQEIMESGMTDQEKKDKIFNKLVRNTVNMKREFEESMVKLKQGGEIKPYEESAA